MFINTQSEKLQKQTLNFSLTTESETSLECGNVSELNGYKDNPKNTFSKFYWTSKFHHFSLF